ncbi:Iron(III) dicitrate transport ATP-binding protein fecE [Mycoplasma haemocanis str. Illinois]|uniref:Iron(III) dicitrate transport ATP-binding protein fecE n=1 Tax=Mycoplasma haemocanis (strain Illinois) TaxID=1111676 RepID=H6N7Y4_MYCHN|nr:ABC transporter ATP-binding protein [Mycoplasma haemocanis]AEW45756.2 Iron(III) dicitrate transport ATP-binding protein fecE [Mycoplasma haemocanis str. Illinois]
MVLYIKKNTSLFVLSISLFLQLVLIGAIFISYLCNWHAYTQLKNDTNLSTSTFHSYSYIELLKNSGESMSTQHNLSRLHNYQNQELPNLIKKFFGISNSHTSSNGVTDIANLTYYFWLFNLHLQLSIIYISLFIFLSILSITSFFKSLWNSILLCRVFNFYKLLICLIPLWGFVMVYSWERELLEKADPLLNKRCLSLLRSSAYKSFMKLRGVKYPFDSSFGNYLLLVENLYFSPLMKHSTTKHLRDQYALLRNHREVDEGSHVYTKKPFFGGEEDYILKNINLAISKGSFNVIIGPNGSGKTTLIKTLLNLNENFMGKVIWNGQSVSNINRTSFAQKVSYIPQFLSIHQSLSVTDYLKFARYPYRNSHSNNEQNDEYIIMKAIRDSGCLPFAHKNLDELSGGQKQKILLASILVQEAEVIVLDEPTSFLDIKNQHLFLESLKRLNKNGKTIIMILHDLQQSINYASNLIVMKNGEIYASGAPKEVVTKEMLREVFSIDCKLSYNNGYLDIEEIYAI